MIFFLTLTALLVATAGGLHIATAVWIVALIFSAFVS